MSVKEEFKRMLPSSTGTFSLALTVYVMGAWFAPTVMTALGLVLLWSLVGLLWLYVAWRVPAVAPQRKGAPCGLNRREEDGTVMVAHSWRPTPVSVRVGSWNVGDAPPPSAQDLGAWLDVAGERRPDVVAGGAQECYYRPRAPHASCEADWLATLSKALGSGYRRGGARTDCGGSAPGGGG